VQRGEIWLVDLEPIRGSEADKVRPVILVSNDHLSARVEVLHKGVLTVVPMTTSTGRVLATQILVEPRESGLARVSKAQADQIRALDISRFQHYLGRLTPERLWELDEAISLHLGLD
jgi:mRNA interferase MazF